MDVNCWRGALDPPPFINRRACKRLPPRMCMLDTAKTNHVGAPLWPPSRRRMEFPPHLSGLRPQLEKQFLIYQLQLVGGYNH